MPQDHGHRERGQQLRAHVSLKLCSDPWTIQRGIQLAKLGLAELSGHAVAKAVPARVGVVAYYEWVTLTLTFTTAHGSSGSEDYRPLRQAVKRHRPFSFGVFRGWFVGAGAKTDPQDGRPGTQPGNAAACFTRVASGSY